MFRMVLVFALIFGSPSLWALTFDPPPEVPVESPRYQRIFVIVFENTDYANALKAPFFREIADRGVLFTNLSAATHPSQGNYIAMTSGSTHGVNHDFKVTLDVSHIGDLMEDKGLTWKVYAEDFPGNCYLGNKGDYVRRHVPFLNYRNVQNDKARCERSILKAEEFATDLQNQQLANLTYYVPNLKNDGHDKGVNYADKWFRKKFENLLVDPNFMDSTLFIVTFDEAEGFFWGGSNQIYTSFYASDIKAGFEVGEAHSHYSLLRLIEDNFAVGNLGLSDATAPVIEGIWQ